MADKQAVSIRFPLGMYKKIKELKGSSYRSFNGEVIWLLRKALDVVDKEHEEEELLANELAKKLNKITSV